MMKKYKIRSILGLVLLYLATFLNWQWAWGILFLFWVIPDLFTGITYFIEPISRKENPFIYWGIIGLWLFTGAYMLIDSLAPKILPQGWSTELAYQYPTTPNDSTINVLTTEDIQSDTLHYNQYIANDFYVVGISAKANYNEVNELAFTLEKLWEAFYKNEPSSVIEGIIDDKIYVVYSNYDKTAKNICTITIGYKTTNATNLYNGLTAVKVGASKYAGFNVTQNIQEEIPNLWLKVSLSDLERSKTNDIEIYNYNSTTNSLEKAKLLIAVPTTSADLAPLKQAPKTEDKKDVVIAKPVLNLTQILSNGDLPEQVDTIVEQPIAPVINYPKSQQLAFNVVGLQTKANYLNEKELGKKMEQLWTDFSKKNYARFINDIINPNNVYVTYTNYTDNEVTITLGYKTTSSDSFKSNKGLNAVNIAQNDYYQFPISTDEKATNQKEWEVLLETLAYRNIASSDFEVYTFNKNYTITNAIMYVAAK